MWPYHFWDAAEIDRPALKALPATPYQFAEWKKCRAAPDYHVEIADHYYSVPSRLIREQLEARSQHPVTTAAGSLGWRVAPEQVGVGFVHLDELGKIIDAEACEGRYRLVIGAEDGETTVFRIHFVADLV